ncbi:MAG: U32 family peptidase, partial [Spirochaetales bacterium]|nr:U32 family peptidase [Spirochaetales bacterium]
DVFSLDVKNTMTAGEPVEYIGPDILYLEDATFELLDETLTPAPRADHGKTSYIKTGLPIKPGYIIRKRLSAC